MVEAITPRQFHEAEGVEDWRVLFTGACAHFRTGSFATGVALVDQIGQLADAADHHPDVDLRYPGVTVRLITHEVGALTHRDIALAAQISAAARALGVSADPASVQELQVAFDDVRSPAAVMPFWQAVLGYRQVESNHLADPGGRGPSLFFQQSEAGGSAGVGRRLHVDVSVPHDQADARVAGGVAAGGRIVFDREAPAWRTLADAEGNLVDIASWVGRD